MILIRYAVGILPKLRVHEENVMEELVLDADKTEEISDILEMNTNSVWVGKVEILGLGKYAVGILPKLRIHGENVMEELVLSADKTEHTSEILKEKNNSIWVGRAKILGLGKYAVGILPKLRIHGENVMEELVLSADEPECIAEILEAKDKSIWIGKVRKISFEGYAEEIKDKLGFTMLEPENE